MYNETNKFIGVLSEFDYRRTTIQYREDYVCIYGEYKFENDDGSEGEWKVSPDEGSGFDIDEIPLMIEYLQKIKSETLDNHSWVSARMKQKAIEDAEHARHALEDMPFSEFGKQ